MREADIQSKIIRWLKSKGCVVLKIQAGPGVPQGFPDLLWCYRKAYGLVEVKASKNAKKQPHQAEFIRFMRQWGVPSYFVYPENFDEIKQCIEKKIEEENDSMQN